AKWNQGPASHVVAKRIPGPVPARLAFAAIGDVQDPAVDGPCGALYAGLAKEVLAAAIENCAGAVEKLRRAGAVAIVLFHGDVVVGHAKPVAARLDSDAAGHRTGQ